MGSITILCFFYLFIFFLLRICGLAVSELPVMGSPWATGLGPLGFVIIFFFFQILVQIFFGVFFFGLKVEQITDKFFFF